MNNVEAKDCIRNSMRNELKHIPLSEKNKLSSLIIKKVLEHKDYVASTLVLIYYPLLREVDTTAIIEGSLLLGKNIALPVINNDVLEFHLIDKDYKERLTKSAFGSMEPIIETPSIKINEYSNILLIVPGLAFSLSKERLGRSKGFYDRFIKSFKDHLTVMGLCFDVQLLKTIPTDRWDERVDCIITDKRIIG